MARGLALYNVTRYTRDMNTTKIREQLQDCTIREWSNPRGEVHMYASKASRVAHFCPEDGGTIHVSLFIDYGPDGECFCDAGTYKTEAGALRKARGFLK